jgi:hypothetical protein
MDFEYLIWFLIFLVYIGLFILKRMRSKSKSKSSGGVQFGWKKKLDDFLARAKKEMNENRQGGATTETVWDRFLSEEYDESEPVEDEEPPVTIEPVTERRAEPIIKPDPVAVGKRKRATVDSPTSIPLKKEEPSRRSVDLKKAVVWAEILGPPVALKEDR